MGAAGRNTTRLGSVPMRLKAFSTLGVGAGPGRGVGGHGEGRGRDRVAHLDPDRPGPFGLAALVRGQRGVDELSEEVVGGEASVAFPARGPGRRG